MLLRHLLVITAGHKSGFTLWSGIAVDLFNAMGLKCSSEYGFQMLLCFHPKDEKSVRGKMHISGMSINRPVPKEVQGIFKSYLFPSDVVALRSEGRDVHVIVGTRSPFQRAISSLLYHRKLPAPESWLLNTINAIELKNAVAKLDRKTNKKLILREMKNMSMSTLLNSLNFRDALIVDIAHSLLFHIPAMDNMVKFALTQNTCCIVSVAMEWIEYNSVAFNATIRDALTIFTTGRKFVVEKALSYASQRDPMKITTSHMVGRKTNAALKSNLSSFIRQHTQIGPIFKTMSKTLADTYMNQIHWTGPRLNTLAYQYRHQTSCLRVWSASCAHGL